MPRQPLEVILAKMNIDCGDPFQVTCAWAVSRIYCLRVPSENVRRAYNDFLRLRTEEALTDLCITIGTAERLQRGIAGS